jgi:hypothetical protein
MSTETTQKAYLKRKNYEFTSELVALLASIGELIHAYEGATGEIVGSAMSTSKMGEEYGENLNLSWDGEKFSIGVWDTKKPPFDNRSKSKINEKAQN